MDPEHGRAKSAGQFEETVLPFANFLFRAAYVLCGNAADAEDLTQETYVRAFQGFRRFEDRGQDGVRAWLLTILHNTHRKLRRAESGKPSALDNVTLDEFAAEIERTDLSADLHPGEWEYLDSEVRTALMELPHEYRSVVLLLAFGGMTYREIARSLNCAHGTVMSRLSRGRKLLADTLAEYARARGLSVRPPTERTETGPDAHDAPGPVHEP